MAKFKNGFIHKNAEIFASRNITLTLTGASKQINFIQAIANIDVVLPTASAGSFFEISNIGSGGFDISVKLPSTSGTIGTVKDEQTKSYISSSATWIQLKESSGLSNNLFQKITTDSGTVAAHTSSNILKINGGNYSTAVVDTGNIKITPDANKYEVKRDVTGQTLFTGCSFLNNSSSTWNTSLNSDTFTKTPIKVDTININTETSNTINATGEKFGGSFFYRNDIIIKSKVLLLVSGVKSTGDSTYKVSNSPIIYQDIKAKFFNKTGLSTTFTDTNIKRSPKFSFTVTRPVTGTTSVSAYAINTSTINIGKESNQTNSNNILLSLKLKMDIENLSMKSFSLSSRQEINSINMSIRHKILKRTYMARIG